VDAVCSPTYVEEFILGRRYLLDDLMQKEYPVQPKETLSAMEIDTILRLTSELFETPGDLFQSTGCAHSCALVTDGQVQCYREDIGRHNALDKVIGYALKNGIPISKSVIFSSGRISQDYLEKVIKAGFKIVVSRAAVTASAVALAREKNITMLGFIRRNGGNIYHVGEVAIF
jgi:FdhD protein